MHVGRSGRPAVAEDRGLGRRFHRNHRAEAIRRPSGVTWPRARGFRGNGTFAIQNRAGRVAGAFCIVVYQHPVHQYLVHQYVVQMSFLSAGPARQGARA